VDTEQVFCRDKLITIFNDAIVLKKCYVFSLGLKRVRFLEIDSITAETPVACRVQSGHRHILRSGMHGRGVGWSLGRPCRWRAAVRGALEAIG